VTAQTVLGSTVCRSIALGGGAARVELADGRTVVVKDGPGVAAEAAGLAWLEVPGGPPVPAVLDRDGDRLVTSYVPGGRSSRQAAAQLGRRLAVLHAAGAPGFGSGPPGAAAQAWIGRAPMTNVPRSPAGGRDSAAWAPWYAEDRIAPPTCARPATRAT
jgi:fructosamine-3-kinase